MGSPVPNNLLSCRPCNDGSYDGPITPLTLHRAGEGRLVNQLSQPQAFEAGFCNNEYWYFIIYIFNEDQTMMVTWELELFYYRKISLTPLLRKIDL